MFEKDMRIPTMSLTLAGLACAPGVLLCQQGLRAGTGIGVQAVSMRGWPGSQVTPTVQAMLSYGIFDPVEIGTVFGLPPGSGVPRSGLAFQSSQLEPRFVPFPYGRVESFMGGRTGDMRSEAQLPLAGRRMAAGGFALGAIGGAGFRMSPTVSLELGATVSSVYYANAGPGTYRGKGKGLGVYLGTSVDIGR